MEGSPAALAHFSMYSMNRGPFSKVSTLDTVFQELGSWYVLVFLCKPEGKVYRFHLKTGQCMMIKPLKFVSKKQYYYYDVIIETNLQTCKVLQTHCTIATKFMEAEKCRKKLLLCRSMCGKLQRMPTLADMQRSSSKGCF